MILQTLVEYYDILASADAISRPGYCIANVSYALILSKTGELVGVMPLKETVQRGKKQVEVPRKMMVPEQVKKTVGITSNFLCENSGYMLGVDTKGKPERTKDCFAAFRNLHNEIFSDLSCVYAVAVLAFINAWDPETAADNPVLQECFEEVTAGANLVFYIDDLGFVHENDEVKHAWERYKTDSSDEYKAQCLVTGRTQPIARLHPSIKGVKGAQSTGASIVSFNARAYESYAHDEEQGYNSPISESAAFKYTTVLNYLLADVGHRQMMGDTTVLFWAASPKSIYQDLFSFTLNPAEKEAELADDGASSDLIGELFKKIAEGKAVSDFENVFDSSVRFYILGLSPNAARLSIRFFIQDSFGHILERLMAHYKDMSIQKAPNEHEFVPLWKLMQETVSPKSKDKASSPLLSGAVLRAILSGGAYPDALYNSLIIRIRAEREITRGKVGAIKACLIRKNVAKTRFKEELTVSLNPQSENRPYVLGRLFSALEKAQQDANPGINTTIKDRYFTSACATPASVFPILLKLSSHHISKAAYGYTSENKIRDLMDKLDVDNKPFPSHLTLDEQGVFILGYYHQQKANYEKTNKEEK